MVISFLCFSLNRDFQPSISSKQGKQTPDKGLRHVISNRNILLTSFANVLWSSIQLTVSTYLVLFLTEKLLLSVILAGAYLAVAQTAAGAGRVIWGIISDRLFGGERKTVLIIIGILTTIATLAMAALTKDTPAWILFITVALMGFSVIGRHGVSITFIAELVGKELAGTATGVHITIAYMGIILGPPAFGHIVDTTGSYSLAWLIFCVVSAFATGIFSLVHPPRS